MRQRNIKNLNERISENSRLLIDDPRGCRGHWNDVFGNSNPIYLEIGCGKGKFITGLAAAFPENNYIAVEGQSSVVLRALEKAEEQQIGNLRIFIDYVNDLKDYFCEGELSGIYLNFCDPWPKARHAKRRLTYHKRLKNYMEALGEDGFIEFKTDNDGLFDFTIEEVREVGLEIAEMTRDLHGSGESGGSVTMGLYAAQSKLFKTEYEEKFSSQGKNINFVRI